MTKEKGVAPATENTAQAPSATHGKTAVEDLQAMSEALAKRGEFLAQADEKIEMLAGENDKLKAENSSLKALNDGLTETVKELNEEIANQETENAKLSKRSTVKVGKDTYELPVKKCVYLRDGVRIEITKEVLDADPALAKELAEKNNGVLVKKGGK
jgi:small-conductance mechanosensitive channel